MLGSCLILKLLVLSLSSFGQQATSSQKNKRTLKNESMKVYSIQKPKQKKIKEKEDDADSVITNKRLRAETGSKSRFSLSTSLMYMGGSLTKPFDSKRPNISGAAAISVYSSLTGAVSAKWNISKLDSLSAGIGASMMAPFVSNLPENAGNRYQVYSPYITYQHLNKFYGVQTVFTFGATYNTVADIREQGYLYDLGPGLTLAYDFGGSKFTVGANISYIHRFFDKDTSEVVKVDPEPDSEGRTVSYLAGYYQDDYSLGVYPFAEYQINDTFNIRTLIGLWVYDHARVEDNFFAVKKNKVYQSVGVGISVTRDIYIYPNVQFIPDDLRADYTNLAISTYINVF